MYKRLPPTWPPKMTHLSCSVDCPPVDSSSRSSYKVRHLSCRRFFLYSFFFSDERSSHKGSHNGTNSLIDFFLHSGTLSFCSSINIMKAFRLFFPILQITLYSGTYLIIQVDLNLATLLHTMSFIMKTLWVKMRCKFWCCDYFIFISNKPYR